MNRPSLLAVQVYSLYYVSVSPRDDILDYLIECGTTHNVARADALSFLGWVAALAGLSEERLSLITQAFVRARLMQDALTLSHIAAGWALLIASHLGDEAFLARALPELVQSLPIHARTSPFIAPLLFAAVRAIVTQIPRRLLGFGLETLQSLCQFLADAADAPPQVESVRGIAGDPRWRAIAEAAGLPVNDIFARYVDQPEG
jgi:hypothetical protein